MDTGFITGFHALEELARTARIRGEFLRSESAARRSGPRVRVICEAAGKNGIPITDVPDAELDRRFPDNRGLVFIPKDGTATSPEVNLDFFLEGEIHEPSLVVVLDGIQDPHNFGAVLRTCDQFRADLVILPNKRSVRETDAVARGSAGAVAWVPTAIVPNLGRALDSLKDKGFWIFGADMDGEPVQKAQVQGRAVLVLGSEGSGMAKGIRDRCDVVLGIPSKGRVDSLNVSVAAGILMFEMRRLQAYF
jgi:23S rRNA (guanosine2251-2'-O)-methyltransferase